MLVNVSNELSKLSRPGRGHRGNASGSGSARAQTLESSLTELTVIILRGSGVGVLGLRVCEA